MLDLATPWLLSLLILPPLIWFLLPAKKVTASSALTIPFYGALKSLIEQEKLTAIRSNRIGLLFMIWSLVVLAAAGPHWVGDPIPLAREGRNIMLALDLSGSMELNDMMLHGQPVSRLAVVKKAAEDFVKERVGDRIGLILFGTQAYLQTPLTFDKHSVLLRIKDATVGLAGKTTSIGDALGLAVKRLQDVPPAGRVIILLTDGANNSGILPPLKAAELAKDEKIKVYTIGLGADAAMQAQQASFLGFNPSADLDEKTLDEIATLTGGRYFRATDTQTLEAIYKTINQLETSTQEHAQVRPQKEYYPWPLALALFLFFYWLGEQLGVFQSVNFSLNRRHNEVTQ